MADETDLHDAGEGEDAPIENAENSESEPPAKSSELEGFASRMGWAPKDQWKGDPDKWKPADEFLESTVEINRSLSKRLKSVEQAAERMSRTAAAITDKAVREERARWERIHSEAVEAGDGDQALKASRELHKLETTADGPPPETSEFVDRNKAWFNVDPDATALAFQVTERLAKQGLTPAEQLERAEATVRKRYPEYFEDKPTPKQPPAVNAPNRAATTRQKGRGWADLPPSAKAACDDFVRRGRVKSREQYAAMYWKENA